MYWIYVQFYVQTSLFEIINQFQVSQFGISIPSENVSKLKIFLMF